MVNICTNFIHFLLPRQCLLCQSPAKGSGLCDACLGQLPRNEHACPRCANPMRAAEAPHHCGQCLQHPPPFHDALAPLRYDHPVDFLVHQLKFHHDLASARLLGTILAHALQQACHDSLPGVLVPVPLHPGRLRQRGYNQALEIARPVSRLLSIPLDPGCCRRHRATRPQADLPLSQRRANTRDAFVVASNLEGKHVAIIDDVMTSGQTMASLARALLENGADRVSAWCCARTPFHK